MQNKLTITRILCENFFFSSRNSTVYICKLEPFIATLFSRALAATDMYIYLFPFQISLFICILLNPALFPNITHKMHSRTHTQSSTHAHTCLHHSFKHVVKSPPNISHLYDNQTVANPSLPPSTGNTKLSPGNRIKKCLLP